MVTNCHRLKKGGIKMSKPKYKIGSDSFFYQNKTHEILGWQKAIYFFKLQFYFFIKINITSTSKCIYSVFLICLECV